ncbi:cold-shock protein [Halioglobus maricola]|uniref:Cold-shock protein n=1 Tax=Halioglobus maricola TaxID=2601894 RepID=A0A5P9NLS0_9GAMM|nr:cold-shock protein [Halioglobus maricola]
MKLFAKIAIAALIGAAAWIANEAAPQIPAIALFLAAAILSALLPGAAPTNSAPASKDKQRSKPKPQAKKSSARSTESSSGGQREEGQVKWFNGTKGFGFITKDNGDEIFVHFRSILGGDRRGLRDGQRVSFVEAQTDKGPQAEEVEPLEDN